MTTNGYGPPTAGTGTACIDCHRAAAEGAQLHRTLSLCVTCASPIFTMPKPSQPAKSSKKDKSPSSTTSALKSKSPAEFFAEHQNIAGFDNAGKSLYTTVREFVENALDAAEAVHTLPDIRVTLERLDNSTFNQLRGIQQHTRKDQSLYQPDKDRVADKAGKRAVTVLAKKAGTGKSAALGDDKDDEDDIFALTPEPSASLSSIATQPSEEAVSERASGRSYFRITCTDNGVGMPHSSIPNMLGIVLSSTKYGVKQTRGKFGLGAKMALVWAKKSTGLPIQVRSATNAEGRVSECTLDIDIHKNEPRVIRHEQVANSEHWRGTEISVVIEGNWTTYRSKVIQYFKQLAVITPYANMHFDYTDPHSATRCFSAFYRRRTDVMPPPPVEVKHHPSSVDNLLVESLIHNTKEKRLDRFLSREFSNISTPLAHRLLSELDTTFTPTTPPAALSKKQVHQLTHLLQEAKFDRPSSECLSPAGEYNLRLGIIKEMQPDMVATFRDEAGVSEGHPFVVEAAVSVGGRCKPGVNVYRYANRIPLLFEGSNDVVSVVCNKHVRWAAYRIKLNTDRIGVFVSIVSSKVPFKGTSKEYIGDDRGVLHDSVKRSVVGCCLQLKKRIASRQRERDREERKKLFKRYIPDVTRAVWGVLTLMQTEAVIPQWTAGQDGGRASKRRREAVNDDDARAAAGDGSGGLREGVGVSAAMAELYSSVMKRMRSGELSGERLSECLNVCVERKNSELAMEYVVEQGRKTGEADYCQLGLFPTHQREQALTIYHPLARLRLV